jgi:hypothetical protein
MNSTIKYFKVTCKCGHTGTRRKYIPITFPVYAENACEAAAYARYKPRCKHHQKDCILEVKECTYDEYLDLIKLNRENPYLHCHCIQDQQLLHIEDQFVDEPNYVDEREIKFKNVQESSKTYYYGKKVIRNPKQYMKHVYNEQYIILEDY